MTGAALVQSVWLSQVSLLGARPDLVFLLVLGWSATRQTDEGLVWGLVAGLVLDLLSGGPLGVYVLALLAVAFVAGQPLGEGLGSPLVRMLLLAIVCGLSYHLTILIALSLTGRTVDWGYAVLRVVGPTTLLNTLIAPFVWSASAWVQRRTQGERFAL